MDTIFGQSEANFSPILPRELFWWARRRALTHWDILFSTHSALLCGVQPRVRSSEPCKFATAHRSLSAHWQNMHSLPWASAKTSTHIDNDNNSSNNKFYTNYRR